MMSDQPRDPLAERIPTRTAIFDQPPAGQYLLVGLWLDNLDVHGG
jgi:hypothetical protein